MRVQSVVVSGFLLLAPVLALAEAAASGTAAPTTAPAASSPATPAAAPSSAAPAAPANSDETYRLLKLFGDVFERVRAEYVEPVKDEELVEAAISGMLTHLDPHSAYMNANEYRDMRVQTRGEFGGLGIEVTMENNAVKVISPIDDTPASRAGVQAGDLIVELDEKTVMGMSLQDAVNKMRGPAGTSIKLTIVRTGSAEPIRVTLTRAVIRVESVKSRVEGNVGYLRITSFTDRTQDGLDHAIADIKKQLGAKLEGWVLDLRNNPGGLLDQAVSVSDTFLESGEIVSTRARDPDESRRFNATAGDEADGKPVVVLINAGSASASEIVSGALQDHHRAIILGTKSFGKGSVQTVLSLGNYGGMRLTTARYYTPSGRSIQGDGITPDIEVLPAKVETVAERGLSIREADLQGALNNDTHPQAAPPAPEATPAPTPAPTPDSSNKTPAGTPAADAKPAPQDYQLTRALDLIHGLALYNRVSGTSPAPAPTPTPKPDEAP